MGLRGPAPTPTAILKARDSRLVQGRAGEVSFGRGVPTCPSFLGKEAKAEWKRQAKALDRAGVLSEVDRAILAAYCEAWGEFVEASNLLKEAGLTITTAKGYVLPHPLVGVKNHAADRVTRLAQQFGFSPSARTRVRSQEQPGEDQPDGVAKFLAC